MTSTTEGMEQSEGLERNAIGLTEVLFQSITFMAPAVAVALSIGFATTLALGITPLAVLLALIAVLFTAFSMGELARHLPSAGGMYTYVGRGLGSFAGWLLAWAFLLASIVIPSILFAAFGFFGADLHHGADRLRAGIPVGPADADLRRDRLVPHLSRDLDLDPRRRRSRPHRDRDHGLRVGAAGDQRRQPEHALGVHPRRRRHPARPAGDGLLPARVRRLRSGRAAGRGDPRPEAQHAPGDRLVGDPDRDLLRVLLLRRDRLLRPGQDGRLHRGQRRQSVGRHGRGGPARASAACLVTFAILNSCLANANSGANASTRSVFALGRSRLIPGAFGTVHPTHRTPATAIHLQAIVGIIIAVGLSLYLGNQYPGAPGPLNTYFTIGYAIGLSFAGDVHGGQPRDDRLLLARAARRVQLVQAPDRAGHRVHR